MRLVFQRLYQNFCSLKESFSDHVNLLKSKRRKNLGWLTYVEKEVINFFEKSCKSDNNAPQWIHSQK